MAVAPERIKARLKALFPKANLSKTRLDALAAKLSQKPADDADDAAIDEVLNTANEFHSFEDIARDDDRIRTLEASRNNPPTPPGGNPPADPATQTDDERIAAIVAKAIAPIAQTIQGFQVQTLQEKFVAQAKAKGIPESLAAKVQIGENFNPEEALTNLETEWSGLKQLAVNATAGAGNTPQGSGQPSKEASKEEAEAIVNDIM